jgi:methoxymalonate biosynthesis acyl carrier protein
MSQTFDRTERISELFFEAVNIEVESSDQDLIESGLLDSLSFVEMLLQIEREFGVDVGVAGFEIDDFRTVKTIAAYVDRHSPQLA